ncbi:MAG: beta-lactamase family protein [Alphaproteobacteria bacterium]|nr:beta-lactamase family protein [Alphaproteobacteria bacterium]
MIRHIGSALVALSFLVGPASAEPSATQRFAAHADGTFATPLQNLGIAGAAIATSDASGDVWFRTYGVSNPGTKARLDASKTSFHVASVTKLITAIAIMQAVDAGKVVLDENVNMYLPADVQLPAAWPSPITVRHLLTHTAGFDVDYLNLATTDRAKVIPLKTFLRTHMPARIRPPGQIANYSNYGYGLLGAVIEQVCHCTYADYVQSKIFGPAGLQASAINTHPAAGKLTRATGFFYRDAIVAEPALLEHMSAAGGALMSVTDLVALIKSLHEGKLMSRESLRSMTTVQFTHHAGLGGGYGFGFWRAPGYTTPVWLVGGDIPGTSTRVLYLPEEGFVACVAVNRKDPQPAERLFKTFLETWRAKPVSPARGAAVVGFDGLYRYHGFPRASFLKIGGLFGPTLEIATAIDSLKVDLPNRRDRGGWRRIAPGLVQHEGTGERLALRTDSNGQQWAFVDSLEVGPLAFERVPHFERPEFAAMGLGLPVIVALVTLMSALVWHRSPTLLIASALLLASSVAFAWGFYHAAIARDDVFAYKPLSLALRLGLTLPWAGGAAWIAHTGVVLYRWPNPSRWHAASSVAVLLLYGWYWFEVWIWHLFLL